MRFFSFSLPVAAAVLSLAGAPYGAFAADEAPLATPPAATGLQAGPSADDAEKPASDLDSLLTSLRRETRAIPARRLASQVTERWGDSGSATINLLMGWAGEAMRKKNNALALDLLAQVTTLQPGYAEGWNRRATLYFAMGDLGRSLADIERTLQLEPRHFGALSGLAVILQKSGQDRKALEIWKQVLSVYPANEAAQKAVIELEDELSGQAI